MASDIEASICRRTARYFKRLKKEEWRGGKKEKATLKTGRQLPTVR